MQSCWYTYKIVIRDKKTKKILVERVTHTNGPARKSDLKIFWKHWAEDNMEALNDYSDQVIVEVY